MEVDRLTKKCPFCGESDSLYSMPQSITIEIGGKHILNDWAVGCKRCSFSILRMTHYKEHAIETWNSRPIEDALTATIAQKDAEIERLTQENAWLTEKALMTPDELELIEKLKLLYKSCMIADIDGELSEYIDGSILDSVSETLKILEVNND